MKTLFFIFLEMSGLNALFRQKNRGKIKTLLYHNVHATQNQSPAFPESISIREFQCHLKHLQEHYEVIRVSPDGKLSPLNPKKVNILLTFDDGFIDNYDLIYPELKSAGLSGCFFLIADCLREGKTPGFLKARHPSSSDRALSTITSPLAKEMALSGMCLGIHGWLHEDFSKLNSNEAVEICTKSQAVLESELGVKLSCFAFPWGRHRKEQLDSLSTLFMRIFTCKHGFNDGEDRVFFRNEVSSQYQLYAAASGSLDFFKSKL